jgi:hypothetical protein
LHFNRNFRLSRWDWYAKGDRYFEIDGTFVTVRIHSVSPYMPIFNENLLVLFVAIILLQPKVPYVSSIVTEISKKLRRHDSYFSYHELIKQNPFYHSLLHYDPSCHFLNNGLGVSY